MKVEAYLFAAMAAFFLPTTVIYWVLSEDWTGTTALVLTIGLAGMVAYYLWFTARRMEARPEDRPDADISEGAGEIGFFPPHSWWPIALAAGFAVTAAGLIFGFWLTIIGLGMVTIASFGYSFEYYVGINRSQGQTLSALEAMGERPTSPHKWLGD